MVNSAFYIRPKMEKMTIAQRKVRQNEKQKHKHADKVSREDVPPMYRKNRKRDIALKTLIIADVLFSLNFILFFAHIITERM